MTETYEPTVAQVATLAHGYTMADIDRISRTAMRKHRPSLRLDYDDRAEHAWHGVVVELYTSPEPPDFYQLVRAALAALDQAVRDELRHHGLAADGEMAPNFGKYWLPIRQQRTDGFSDRLCECLALPSALGVLTDEQYEAIATLAAYDNAAGDAANALGMKYHGFMYRVYAARAKVKQAWFDDETPRQPKPAGETCRSGHSRADHGVRLTNPDRWECRLCKNRSSRSSRRRARAA